MRITEIAEGKVTAWPHPADLRFVVEEGHNPGCFGVALMDDARAWILIDGLLAHWDGIRWTEVDAKTANDLVITKRVAMSFARVSGYGELNPSITLLVPSDQRRIVDEHHTRWRRATGRANGK
jgi:hypothetical protein